MLLGADLSNYSGIPTADNLHAFVTSEDISRLILACEFPDIYASQFAIATAEGVRIDAYRFLYYDRPFVEQVQTALNVILPPIGQPNRAERLWLDLERQSTPAPPDAATQLLAVLDLLRKTSMPCGIYTSQWSWAELGNPQFGRYCPLWLANWDDKPELAPVYFGGWIWPRGKQYKGNYASYGITCDLNVWRS